MKNDPIHPNRGVRPLGWDPDAAAGNPRAEADGLEQLVGKVKIAKPGPLGNNAFDPQNLKFTQLSDDGIEKFAAAVRGAQRELNYWVSGNAARKVGAVNVFARALEQGLELDTDDLEAVAAKLPPTEASVRALLRLARAIPCDPAELLFHGRQLSTFLPPVERDTFVNAADIKPRAWKNPFDTQAGNDALKRLERLEGLDDAKRVLTQIRDIIAVNKLKLERGQDPKEVSFHASFTGNPGTGKTTMAREYARALYEMGHLKKNVFNEVTRADLVKGGQTAAVTKEWLQKSKGGVLFIDEAYSIVGSGKDPAGRECIDTLVKYMEDWRDDVVVIFAGYPDELRELIETNPGLKSRIGQHIYFPDFNDESLKRILQLMVEDSHFTISDELAQLATEQIARGRGAKGFANGRAVRNFLEEAILRQAQRLVKQGEEPGFQPDPKTLRALEFEDLFGPPPTFGKGLDRAIAKLDRLEGVDDAKKAIHDLRHALMVNQQRKEKKLKTEPISFHCAFGGPPGTGKTTVAEIYGEILKEMGFLTRGNVKTVTRDDLVAKYHGQTTEKTKLVLESALGGVLIIDEAHALTQGGKGHGEIDYGKEALNEIVKFMETHRDDLVIIFAGYDDDLRRMVDANPGLRSRIGKHIHFPHFDDPSLSNIFDLMVEDRGYQYPEELREKVGKTIGKSRTRKGFANARAVRNFLDEATVRQGVRLVEERRARAEAGQDADHSVEELRTLTGEDLFGVDKGFGRGLNEALESLQALVGLDEAKQAIVELKNTIEINRLREELGQPVKPLSFHAQFTGNPGTGKTTVARIYGEVLKELGYLEKGQFVEVTRADLVAEYVGQTAAKTRDKLESALGGVLFIDEAYALNEGGNADYGKEALAEIVSFIENHRDEMVVIFAGYSDEMRRLIDTNPGLKSRIGQTIHFGDQSDEGLEKILATQAAEASYEIAPDALKKAAREIGAGRGIKGFANGRECRNFLDQAVMRQGRRLAAEQADRAERADRGEDVPELTAKELVTLEEADLFGERVPAEDRGRHALDRLDNEIQGLREVKEQIRAIRSTVITNQFREKAGLEPVKVSYHCAFTGNPGTGKTTVARLYADILAGLKVLPKGQFKEVTAADLIAPYVGQTGPKTRDVLESALGGVLFIDEAYALTTKGAGGFGEEALAEIVRFMEEHRDQIAIVFAGYTDEMKQMIATNPGLQSRIGQQIEFADYDDATLGGIFGQQAKSAGYKVSAEVIDRAVQVAAVPRGSREFANGRAVRNVLEQAIAAHARRMVEEYEKTGQEPSLADLTTLRPEDILVARAKAAGNPRKLPAGFAAPSATEKALARDRAAPQRTEPLVTREPPKRGPDPRVKPVH